MATVSFSIIIPARFASSRLPGKMLADIHGKPMLEHVYERALQSDAERVTIATDHQDIVTAAQGFGAEVVLTSVDHPSGTDRLQEACQLCEMQDSDLVVNIQGDEPLIPPQVINQVAELLANDTEAKVATLCEPINDPATFTDPNAVKVVMDNQRRALYFSRAPIPWPRDTFSTLNHSLEPKAQLPPDFIAARHLGIYAYRVSLLNQFVTWPMAALEQWEKLEQLRVLAQGEKIVIDKACAYVPPGVDTQVDLDRVRQLVNK